MQEIDFNRYYYHGRKPKLLSSGLDEIRSQNAKALDTIQEVRNGLIPVLKEVHSLRLVDKKRSLESKDDTASVPRERRPQTSRLANATTEQRGSKWCYIPIVKC